MRRSLARYCRYVGTEISSTRPAIRGHPQGLLCLSRNSSAAGADVETVETERGTEVGARLGLLRFERDAGRIGDPVDRIKQADNAGGVDEAGRAQSAHQPRACARERRIVLAEHGFGEF